MVRDPTPFVSEWDTVGDRPGELNLPNPTQVASCSGIGLGETHKIPNRYRTVFPTCYEFPRFDLGAAKLLVTVARTATPTAEADEAPEIPNSALPALILSRMRRGWSISCKTMA